MKRRIAKKRALRDIAKHFLGHTSIGSGVTEVFVRGRRVARIEWRDLDVVRALLRTDS
jgi:hypothetical protein